MAVHKRPQFLLDLADEMTRINDFAGPDVAGKWYDGLLETIEELKRQPLLGRERKDLKPKTVRSWRVKDYPRWLVFYQVEDDAIVFLRVRYGAMDLPELEFES